MSEQRVPNARVWLTGQEYVEAGEILFDFNRMLPACILSALAIEVFLKSFLVESAESGGKVSTRRGHELSKLFAQLTPADQTMLSACADEVSPGLVLADRLREFDNIFAGARYFHEPGAPFMLKSELIYLARHVCDATLLLGKRKGV